MQHGWWSPAAWVAAPLGHLLLLVAFILPWVVGDFGARDAFTGVDLARVAAGATRVNAEYWHGLSQPAEFVLLAVPLLAANALLLHGLALVSQPARDAARRIALWLAGGQALAVLAAMVMLLVASAEVALRPGFGLILAVVGCAFALAPVVLRPSLRGQPQPPILDEAPTSST